MYNIHIKKIYFFSVINGSVTIKPIAQFKIYIYFVSKCNYIRVWPVNKINGQHIQVCREWS